jgi:c-di-GMP-binding flagellar brake protein YcgR
MPVISPMNKKNGEAISGEAVKEILRSLIDSRHLCKIEIPNTPFCWITLLSSIQKEGGTEYLLVDGVPGFESALPLSKNGEIILEYSDVGGVICHFNTRVAKTLPKMIWVECPEVIYRIQRRTFYRMKAPGGTEILFHLQTGKEEKGKIRDYSAGGVAIITEAPLPLGFNEQVKDLSLRIPEEKGWFIVEIPLAAVRRVDPHFQPGKSL